MLARLTVSSNATSAVVVIIVVIAVTAASAILNVHGYVVTTTVVPSYYYNCYSHDKDPKCRGIPVRIPHNGIYSNYRTVIRHPSRRRGAVVVNGEMERTKGTATQTTTTTTTAQTRTTTVLQRQDEKEEEDMFTILADLTASLLIQSDRKRDAIENGPNGRKDDDSTTLTSKLKSAKGATNWIDDEAGFVLRSAMKKLALKHPRKRKGLDRDEAVSWLRWMKSTPTPLIIDLSTDMRQTANETIISAQPKSQQQSSPKQTKTSSSKEDILQRIACRLILLPSGMKMTHVLNEPTGAMIVGKLLYGGVQRYRLINSSSSSSTTKRKVGERTAFMGKSEEETWVQYGGGERKYEALDRGPAALLECIVLPSQGIKSASKNEMDGSRNTHMGDMVLTKLPWSPHSMFENISLDQEEKARDDINGKLSLSSNTWEGSTPISLSGKARNDAFTAEFQYSVGGLDYQIQAIVRRVLDGRILRPADEQLKEEEEDVNTTNDENNDAWMRQSSQQMSTATLEAQELALLGLTPVRGLLLYGPPGCGKTILAREISKALRARTPKIVSAPELLDRWVGGSERLIRNLFADAEAELSMCEGDASKSALHVVVIDEIDAVFRSRSGGEDSGEATRASAVNQILAKLDGVNAIPNVLLIGMTNRRELLDEALLRPGRLEVQIEIPLPDKEGRREIMKIHFDALRKNGRLSKPLCHAIDGSALISPRTHNDMDTNTRIWKNKVGKRFQQIFRAGFAHTMDLASDSMTKGFSGADIAGLVRCAGSIALARARKDGNGIDGLMITLDDVKEALLEVKK